MGCRTGDVLKTPNSEYKVIQKLGKGGQGTAFLVRRTRHKGKNECDRGPLVVCKEENRVSTVESRILGEVLGEGHKRIPKFLESAIGYGSSHLFLQFCSAGDLHHTIAWYYDHHKTIPENFIWTVFCHLAEALAFIHSGHPNHGPADRWDTVIHRDIKPPNVFLAWPHGRRANPNVLLGDFGLAALPSDPGFEYTNRGGSYEWQPPEAPVASTRGDVWALGAIIHACCNGRPPILPKPRSYKDSYQSWAQETEAKRPGSIFPRYSRTLEYWMTRALKKDAKDRISSYELVTLMVPGDGLAGRKLTCSELAEGSVQRERFV